MVRGKRVSATVGTLHGEGPGQQDCGRSTPSGFVCGNGSETAFARRQGRLLVVPPPPGPRFWIFLASGRAFALRRHRGRGRRRRAPAVRRTRRLPSRGLRCPGFVLAKAPQRHRRGHAASRRDHRRNGRLGPPWFGRTRGTGNGWSSSSRPTMSKGSSRTALPERLRLSAFANWASRSLAAACPSRRGCRTSPRRPAGGCDYGGDSRSTASAEPAGHDAVHHARYARSARAPLDATLYSIRAPMGATHFMRHSMSLMRPSPKPSSPASAAPSRRS